MSTSLKAFEGLTTMHVISQNAPSSSISTALRHHERFPISAQSPSLSSPPPPPPPPTLRAPCGTQQVRLHCISKAEASGHHMKVPVSFLGGP